MTVNALLNVAVSLLCIKYPLEAHCMCFVFLDPGYGRFVRLNENHLNVCKPDSRYSANFVLLKDFIDAIIDAEHQMNKL